MKPNNEFTTPESRFFYPVNHGVEHHESLDTTNLPGTENIPGQDHYVTIRNQNGEVFAAELSWSAFNIPVNTVILGVQGRELARSDRFIGRPFLEADELKVFDEACAYNPGDDEGAQLIVQVERPPFQKLVDDTRFDERGVAVLPYGEPLPDLAGDESGARSRYRLLGFIDSSDKLISWTGETGYNSLLVDWCVANQLKQNRLEEALLHDALPSGGHLVGMLSVAEAAKAYLEYFDHKYDTSYVPEEDPRHSASGSQFEQLSDTDYSTYRRLTELATHFMTNPR